MKPRIHEWKERLYSCIRAVFGDGPTLADDLLPNDYGLLADHPSIQRDQDKIR